MLAVVSVDDGFGTVLVSERYRQSAHIDNDGGDWVVDSVPIVRSMPAGESITEQYTLDGERLFNAGTKLLRGHLHETGILQYQRPAAPDWTVFAPDVAVTIEVRSLVP